MKKIILASGIIAISAYILPAEAKPISVKLLQANILNQYYDQGYDFYDQNRAGYDSTYDALEGAAKDYFGEDVKQVKLQHGGQKLNLDLQNRTAGVQGEDESAQYYRGNTSNNNRALNITNNHTGETVFNGTSGTTTQGRNVYQINNHNGVKIKNLEDRDGRNVEQVKIKKIGESNSGVVVRQNPVYVPTQEKTVTVRSGYDTTRVNTSGNGVSVSNGYNTTRVRVSDNSVSVNDGSNITRVSVREEPTSNYNSSANKIRVTGNSVSVNDRYETTHVNVTGDSVSVSDSTGSNPENVLVSGDATYCGTTHYPGGAANNLDVQKGETVVYKGDLAANNVDVAGKLVIEGDFHVNNLDVVEGEIFVLGNFSENNTDNFGAIYARGSITLNHNNYDGTGVVEEYVDIKQVCAGKTQVKTVTRPDTTPTHKNVTVEVTGDDEVIKIDVNPEEQGEILTGKTTIYNGTEVTEIRTKGQANQQVRINTGKEVVVEVKNNGNEENVEIKTTDEQITVETENKETTVNVSPGGVNIQDGADKVQVNENGVKIQSADGETVEVNVEGGFFGKLFKSIFSIFQ